MDVAIDWRAMSPFGLLLAVVVADTLFGALPGLRSLLDAPLNGVRGLGRWLDSKLNRARRGGQTRRLRGLIVVLFIAILGWIAGLSVSAAADRLLYGWILEGVFLLFLVRQGDAVRRMQRGLRHMAAGDFDRARDAVGPLVRYDSSRLDEFGVARAAIEGGMVQFAGGFLSTLFWYLLFGLPGATACRFIGAAADEIGKTSPRHYSFGFAATRLDDIVTLPSAVIAGPLIALAGIFVPRANSVAAMSGWLSDLAGRGVRSDFRGEGAMAGALGVALGGPRPYGDDVIAGAWIGDGRARAAISDVQRSVFLVSIAYLLVALFLALAVTA